MTTAVTRKTADTIVRNLAEDLQQEFLPIYGFQRATSDECGIFILHWKISVNQRLSGTPRSVYISVGANPTCQLTVRAVVKEVVPSREDVISDEYVQVPCSEQSDRSASEHAGFVTLKIR